MIFLSKYRHERLRYFIPLFIITAIISGYISDAQPVSAKASTDSRQMEELTYQLKRNMKAYAALIEAQNNGQHIRENIIQVLDDIVEILKDIKKIYEISSSEDSKIKQAVERMERLIKIYEKKLADFSSFNK